jgi:sRNA-binding protein
MAEILPLSNGNLTKATLAAQEWLETTFPLFRFMPVPDWPNPMPLQLGIYETILSIAPENISPAGVKNFLIQYTSTPEYHQSVYESTTRFDLNAHPTTPITDEERDYARQQLGIQGYERLPDEPDPDEA